MANIGLMQGGTGKKNFRPLLDLLRLGLGFLRNSLFYGNFPRFWFLLSGKGKGDR
jgi:hypothetical protein